MPDVSWIDYYPESNADTGWLLYSGDKIRGGQSFHGDGRTLDRCKFLLSKAGSPTGDMVAVLYSHHGTFGSAGSHPEDILATSDVIDASEIDAVYTDSELVEFHFSTPYSLDVGGHYYLLITYSGGDSDNYVYVWGDFLPPSPTHPGISGYYISSWSPDAGADLIFYAISDEIGSLSISMIYF